MTLEQLRATASAGGVSAVTLKGKGGSFEVEIATRSGHDLVLAKARSTQPRRFSNPAVALMTLRDVGIEVVQTDTSEWNPDQKDTRKVRPATAASLKKAHKALAHSRWLAAQMKTAEADTRPLVSQKEAMARMKAAIDSVKKNRSA